MNEPSSRPGDIAIIGMAGRFPGSNTLEQFWSNLENGRDLISFFSQSDLVSAGVDSSLLANPRYVGAKGEIDGVDLFDADFFGFTPMVATITDPQHRIILECAWEALEGAGYGGTRPENRVGVFVGSYVNKYAFGLYSNAQLLSSVGNLQARIASDKDFLPTLISYKLNLKGPSVAVQTACSTSLVAVHLACQSLLSGDCDMAMAGGVAIQLPLRNGYLFTEGGIESPDGRCRAFDAKAQGTVFGSGAGIVVLKPLSQALADRDSIYAVIRGSAINNDGAAKVGYTAPSVDGQASVISEAMAVAEVEAESIGYIEAHGTATPLGDAVEIAALCKAFGNAADKGQSCAVGSVKSNIGHPDAAAGVASLIKASLSLKNRVIPPSLHFERPHPESHLINNGPFFVNAERREWKSGQTPRRAGVSSFGIGGTNAHVVLQEAPPAAPLGRPRACELLLLSAKTAAALDAATGNLVQHLKNRRDLDLQDVAYTLQVGRESFAHRRFAIVENPAQAVAELEANAPTIESAVLGGNQNPEVAFVFPDLEGVRPNVTRELYEREEAFRKHVDECAVLLKDRIGCDLREAMYPGSVDDLADQRLKDPRIGPVALFVVQYALARLWRQWGIEPRSVVAYGLGGYAAACVAGIWQLRDALLCVADVARLVADAGETPTTSVPDAVLQAVAARCAEVKSETARIGYLSCDTGRQLTAKEIMDPAVWARCLRSPARLDAALNELRSQSDTVLLEIGPGQTFTSRAAKQAPPVRVLPSLPGSGKDPEFAFLLRTAGRLWLAGLRIDWDAFHERSEPRRIPLPTYPFERKRYWIEPTQTVAKNAPSSDHAVSDARIFATTSDTDRSQSLQDETLRIWTEVLGVENLKVQDNFFDLGGNSLIAMMLIAKMRDRFQVDLPLHVLFDAPTVEQLAEQVAQLGQPRPEDVEMLERLLSEVEQEGQKLPQ